VSENHCKNINGKKSKKYYYEIAIGKYYCEITIGKILRIIIDEP
jgi:hypothetical protein